MTYYAGLLLLEETKLALQNWPSLVNDNSFIYIVCIRKCCCSLYWAHREVISVDSHHSKLALSATQKYKWTELILKLYRTGFLSLILIMTSRLELEQK